MALFSLLKRSKKTTAPAGETPSATIGQDYSVWEAQGPAYQPVHREPTPEAPRYVRRDDGSFVLEPAGDAPVATVVCVGDILCEEKLFKAHRDGHGRFDFDSIYHFVRPLICDSDLAIANLETTICLSSPYTGEQYKIDGRYHNNAPLEFLDAIQNAGFEFLMLANNHGLDSGVAGAVETLGHIDERGLMHTGLFDPSGPSGGSVVDVNGIKLGLLSYSTWFNRNETRLTQAGRQSVINEWSAQKGTRDIEDLRRRGAEFILVYMHWGVDAEYSHTQSRRMEALALEVANAGADYIVGSHTHSVQPYTKVLADKGRTVPCIYSMGNFVTSEMNPVARSSALLKLRLEKKDGTVIVSDEQFVPCYVPDQLLGIGYPVVPQSSLESDEAALAACKKGFTQVKSVIGQPGSTDGTPYLLTKSRLCSILGLPQPDTNEVYTSLRFAVDAVPGCVALVNDLTSDPAWVTPKDRCRDLARIAMDKGASLLLSPMQIEDYPCLIVPDAFAAYCTVITAIRNNFSPRTISVTGSIGKTTTSDMVHALIKSKYNNTHYTTGNSNTVRNCGTMVQRLKSNHEFYVQEIMEASPPGSPSVISKMAQPQASIVTVVGTSHLEQFGTQEKIWESCLGIQDGMPDDGLLILNGDDPLQHGAQTRLKSVWYGIEDEDADYRGVNIHGKGDELHFDVLHNGRSTPVTLHCFGRHNVLDALAAFAAGEWAGMTESEIVQGLASYRTSGIRQNLVTWGGQKLYLDCYNSSKESVVSALDALSMIELPEGGKRVAVLADVLELGNDERPIHEEIGRSAAHSCADTLIFYGACSRFSAETARNEGRTDVYHALTPDELMALIGEHVGPQDVALFKGSHGMELELVVDTIWGTWYHEESERGAHQIPTTHDEDFEYRLYSDHATVTRKRSTATAANIPSMVEGRPVTSIADSAFSGSGSTETVSLPNSLRNIRWCAFYKVAKLTEVDIPASVRIVHASAFSTCPNLREVHIEPGCIHLGYRAFGNCTNLERIDIPATVQQIGNEAFINCKKLKIHGEQGSYAQRYAAEHKIPFVVER